MNASIYPAFPTLDPRRDHLPRCWCLAAGHFSREIVALGCDRVSDRRLTAVGGRPITSVGASEARNEHVCKLPTSLPYVRHSEYLDQLLSVVNLS